MTGLQAALRRMRAKISRLASASNATTLKPRAPKPETVSTGQSEALRAWTEDQIGRLPTDLVERLNAIFDPAEVAAGAFAGEDVVLFPHIPKTAGSALLYSMGDAFDLVRTVRFLKTEEDLEREWMAARKLAVRRAGKTRQIIAGHVLWRNFHPILKGPDAPVAVSFIRNPADRLLSNYNYNCSDKHPPHERFQARYPTFRDYIDRTHPNPQLRQLVGPAGSFEAKLERLIKHYRMIGLTEHLAASLIHLERSFLLNTPREYVANVAEQGGRRAEMTPELRDEICMKHREDWLLFVLLEPAMARFAASL